MNDPMIFFENKTAKVYYQPDLDALFLEYQNKVVNDDDFIIINTAVLEAFKKLNTQKFVADIRKMGVISVTAQQWVVKNLVPGLIAHLKGKPLFHAQFLDPSEIFSKISAKNIKSKTSQEIKDFNLEQFSDRQELEQYLKTVLPLPLDPA